MLYNEDKNESERPVKDRKGDKKIIKSLKEFLGSDVGSSHNLELIVSLHFLLTLIKRKGRPSKDALELLRKLKPFFSIEETEYYYKKLRPIIRN